MKCKDESTCQHHLMSFMLKLHHAHGIGHKAWAQSVCEQFWPLTTKKFISKVLDANKHNNLAVVINVTGPMSSTTCKACASSFDMFNLLGERQKLLRLESSHARTLVKNNGS